MIKNDKQYAITKKTKEDFQKSLESMKSSEIDDRLNKIMMSSVVSQIESFDKELKEFEILKRNKPMIISSSIEKLPETLIKVRIVKGLSQNDLAQ